MPWPGSPRGRRSRPWPTTVGYKPTPLNPVRAETGLSPEEYQWVALFEGSRDLVLAAASTGSPLADAAARVGYSDQAHLSREWRELAGCPPSQWLREEFPNLQAGGRTRAAP